MSKELDLPTDASESPSPLDPPGEAAGSAPALELPDVAEEPLFVIDDDEDVRDGMERFLARMGYSVRPFATADAALGEIETVRPMVVVTDNQMPGMSGLELAERAVELDPEVRIIVVTGAGDETTAQKALRLGVTDYLTKPLDYEELARTVRGAFLAYARETYARSMETWLREEVRRQTGVIRELTVGSLTSLVNVLEARSSYFKGHSEAVAECAEAIARVTELPDSEVRAIRTAGLLHDIGMVAVPDEVVEKPGDLTPEERAVIQEHCQKGADILEPLKHLGVSITYILEHHERLDGSGYPEGKRGDGITLGGQIVGLSETWTAITEDRPYRDRMSSADAMATLAGAAGLWYSADLVEALRIAQTS